MIAFTLAHPTATLARGIEDLVIHGEHSSFFIKGACALTARLVSVTVFPVFLSLELLFIRIPKILMAIGTDKCANKADKALKYFLAIIPSIVLGSYSPTGVPGFFLKRQASDTEIRPFGVEKIFGAQITKPIEYPTTFESVQNIVQDAKSHGEQISVIGAGMSQGRQTVPDAMNKTRVINTKHLSAITVNTGNNTVTVGAGATWEEIQLALDRNDKSIIVKQASDIFSVGGSIGINCHGWAHEYGSISTTVRELKVVDAEGNLRILTPPRKDISQDELTDDEKLFKCMFGTLGYFGIIVEATLDIVDNDMLRESTEEVSPDEFYAYYNNHVKNKDIPLFGGRLVLDTLSGQPLRKVCMVSYRKFQASAEATQNPVAHRNINAEPKYGTRFARIGLKLISNIHNSIAKRVISLFWRQERRAMLAGSVMTRNEALHPPINAFKMLHHSDLYAEWLQEYFIEKDKLPEFLRYLGKKLGENNVRLINATIRPTPKDTISILPYAEQDRFAVVICFAQKKTQSEMDNTKKWISEINDYLVAENGVFYQAYMPYASKEQFEKCYGAERVEEMRQLKHHFDPENRFGNAHTTKYYDRVSYLRSSIPSTSPFRTVFSSLELRGEFIKFLKTIFYQLDEHKVLKQIDEILSDPSKSDKDIYEQLVASIDQMRKRSPALFHQLKSLSVLQKGMGLQSAQLMKDFSPEKFQSYLEIYFRRYFKTIQKTAKMPFQGKIYDVSDKPHDGSIKEKIEAGALFSSYPYKRHVPLNDSDCQDPETEPEKTHKPIDATVPDGEIDLISCLGGLHHIPKERVSAFVESMHKKLRPGGVILLRDHDVTTPALRAIASVVHSFVNATNGVKWESESREVREFESAEYWTNFMKSHHFTQVSTDKLVLPGDPTQNAMMAFVKTPENLSELQIAAKYRQDCVRSSDGTRSTWIEWGNVRYSKQYAAFIQTRHSYAFDYIGHMRQHWNHFSQYIKESNNDLPLKSIIFSENFAINLFILLSTTFECLSGYIASVPSMLIGRLKNGANWRNALDLTALERYEAQIQKEYSEFIDHTPFHMFPYLSKIKGLWSAIWTSNENLWVKFVSSASSVLSTLSLTLKAVVCLPIRITYTQNGQYTAPDRVAILIHDRSDQFQTGDKQIGQQKYPIEVVYQTPDKYKVVLVPRYRPFTQICKELALNDDVKLLEIGSQPKVTVDVVFKKGQPTPKVDQARLIYEMDILQDAEERRYATYEVEVSSLASFEKAVGPEKIEYIHE